MNPNCEVVDCLIGNNFQVSDPICGSNAQCLRNAEGVYGCECLPGYTGDPLDSCERKIQYCVLVLTSVLYYFTFLLLIFVLCFMKMHW